MIKAIALENVWLNFSDETKAAFKKNKAYQFQFKKEEELTESDFLETEVLVGLPKPDLLAKYKNLKWLQLLSAGTNGYTQGADFPEDVTLTNATGTYGLTISEHLLTMAFILLRKFDLYEKQQEKEIWENIGQIQSIYGSTVLVHGLGDIGSHFAQKIQALGGHVIAVKRTVYGDEEFADEVYAETDLDKVLPRADIIASSVPGTHETYKLFNQEKFDLMKENAIFLNVGRGTNVDLEALCDALESKKIAGGGIDVTDPEPLPKGHRAWHTERLLITPHASGGYTLPETWRRFMKILEKNLDAYANGKDLTNIVDMKTGYKRNAHK